jgi:hypothetical protein
MADKYMVYSTNNRETKTLIQLFDTAHKDNEFDTSLRWAVFCAPHKVVDFYSKQNEAYKAMTKPSEWCSDCSDLASGKVAPVTPSETLAEASQSDIEEDDDDYEEDEEEEEDEVTIDLKN